MAERSTPTPRVEKAPFVGSGVAMVTPFTDRGVNEPVLRELVDFHVKGGTDALIVCGSTGEASTMTPDEQRRAIEVAVEAAAKRIPIVAGLGGSDTAAVSRLGVAAREVGADVLLISPPPYNKPTQAGILAHYRAVMDAAGDLPVIVYNVPGRTACNILPETIEKMAEDPRIAGVKEASGDLSQIAELCRRVADRVAIYSGNDDQTVPVMSLGGMGIISVLGNVAPGETSRMAKAFLEGDVAESRRLQLDFLPLIAALFREPNPIPVKAAVGLLGFDVGPVRLPLTEPSPAVMEGLRNEMRAMGLLDGGR
jgi:4-hydroxy-tetrahydrodipicolinate synthase